mmetsp:Transcript_22498/g.31723  ORF Transcript_22498/g.31723 Transcript_22498/m.31723 type:complete len:267 (-) Transcript_22498:198-998(-)
MERSYPEGPLSVFLTTLAAPMTDLGLVDSTTFFSGVAVTTFSFLTAAGLGVDSALIAPGEFKLAKGAVMISPRAAAAPPRIPTALPRVAPSTSVLALVPANALAFSNASISWAISSRRALVLVKVERAADRATMGARRRGALPSAMPAGMALGSASFLVTTGAGGGVTTTGAGGAGAGAGTALAFLTGAFFLGAGGSGTGSGAGGGTTGAGAGATLDFFADAFFLGAGGSGTGAGAGGGTGSGAGTGADFFTGALFLGAGVGISRS